MYLCYGITSLELDLELTMQDFVKQDIFKRWIQSEIDFTIAILNDVRLGQEWQLDSQSHLIHVARLLIIEIILSKSIVFVCAQCRKSFIAEKNSIWQPSCASANVSYVEAKWRLKNVGLNTHSLFILFTALDRDSNAMETVEWRNTSDSFIL